VSDEQREAIERLERRVEVLEHMMRRLLATPAAPEPPAAPAVPPTTPRPRPPQPVEVSLGAPAAEARVTDLEQWFGQRGLLIVGVLALLAAAGFFLKYAFDRGWVPPAVRSLLAIVAGVGVAAWGEQRIGRGMRRYGAAMIGAGGGLAYLGLWAAAGPYALVDRRVGVLLLAGSTVSVTLLALRHEIEGLAIWALAGAYLAPVVLRPPVPNPDAFLGYLEVIGLGTGLLAYAMAWRRAFDLALFGYLALAATGAFDALHTPLGCWFVAAGALLALHVTRRRPWPEARLGVVLAAWLILGPSFDFRPPATEPALWLGLGAAFAIAGLLWWQQLAPDPFGGDAVAGVERLLFLVNPFALLVLARAAGPSLLEHAPGALPAVLGGIYLSAGWARRTASLLIMGFALIALACAIQWSATATAVCWTGLVLAALAADRWGERPGARAAALGAAALAFLWLFLVAVGTRRSGAPAFTDAWALALYAYLVCTAFAARWWRSITGGPAWEARGTEALWALCGAAVFIGGSIELWRYFSSLARLAGDFSLSVFWLLYSGVLVRLGFRLNRKDVRSAGLGVAAGAGLKIVLYDLANLEALYRIASFFALALIALAVAYTYNKKSSRDVVEGSR